MADLADWSDSQLLNRLLAGARGAGPSAAELEGEMARRCVDARRKEDVRRMLKGYASAAPEYVDEDAQAAARRYLAVLEA